MERAETAAVTLCKNRKSKRAEVCADGVLEACYGWTVNWVEAATNPS